MKRILSLVLCLALLLTLLCMPAAQAEEADWFAGKDFSKHLTISIASVQIDSTKNYYDSDEWCKWWGDTFNVDFDITPLGWDNWAENLRIWIAGGDMPDWCVWNYVHGDMANYADQGLVKCLPDDWKDKYPNIAAAQSHVQLASLDEELFGGTYALFRPNYALNSPAEKVTDHVCAYIRKDWAAAVGYDLKSGDTISLPQLYDLAEKLKEADPGNVGEGFTPIVSRSEYTCWLIQFNNAHAGVCSTMSPFYVGDDGLYHWGGADESTLEALKGLKDAYDKGLVHQEFYTLQEPDDMAHFYSAGDSAISITVGMSYLMDDYAASMKKDLGVDFNESVACCVVTGYDDLVHGMPQPNFWAANIFNPEIDDEKLERILYMMDYSATAEGQERIHFGVEGTDYVKNDDGTYTVLISQDESLWDKYAMLPIYVNMIVLSDDFQFDNPTYSETARATAKLLHQVRAERSTEETFPSKIDWTAYLHASKATSLATMTYQDEYAKLIVASGDITENWTNWVNEKMNLIQPVLDELNAEIGK